MIHIAGAPAALIKNARKPTIWIHRQPDADAIGSAVALAWLYERWQVTARLVCEDKVSPVFNQIVLGRSFSDRIGTDSDLILLIDCPNLRHLTHFPRKTKNILLNNPYLVIDHHKSNTLLPKATASLVYTNASSTCEIIMVLLEHYRIQLPPDIANVLLAGIYADTGGLSYINTSADTLLMTAKLMRRGAKFNDIRARSSTKQIINHTHFLGRMLNQIGFNKYGMAVSKIFLGKNEDFDQTEGRKLVKKLAQYSQCGLGALLIIRDCSYQVYCRSINHRYDLRSLNKIANLTGLTRQRAQFEVKL